ncbi:sigma-70 family RNA polymerase sigma factor [Pelagicoccus sp. NFK12]|jgi:RNA polymerase sigma-70 factor (ECF subfamily)|uniref:Sigma-70 family RNA polymerase sigma factor n=1 Tax=Pelagicoccus enzymogenes TaxID=2773457 RepID=A0A927IJF5_9BACT|nr:sigma-70 family RNA polymerase sigma factor [Pelagicoccus enzymogenes]MBD5781814.1 sigma-70 family RNA polymerase sigma factor [Pelagicoccus enzymogenes]MDQ8196570.1 sigma-70 family RNA polymerase sigma factor [Pelagicoccus enzymogenes]
MSISKAIKQTLVSTPERRQEADEDLAIVHKVQAGDVDAFDELVTKYRERIYSVVYNLTSNREDASDLTQDAFIKAFQSIGRFKGKSSFFTWLYRIALNTTLTHLRKNKLRRFFSFEKMNEEDHSAGFIEQLKTDSDSDKNTLMNELQEKLNDAFQKLSVKHRTVITLYEIDGLSHKEIAEIVGTSVGTVRSRLHYAKQFLQAELKDYVQ